MALISRRFGAGVLDRARLGAVITSVVVFSTVIRARQRVSLWGWLAAWLIGTWASTAAAQADGAGSMRQPATSGKNTPEAIAPADGTAKRATSKLLEIGVEAALDRARSSYQAGRYDDCVKEYGELLAHQDEMADIPAASIEQARTYYAACSLATGNEAEADQQLRAALTANPLMASPDPVVFPDQVRDLFFKVKADFLDEIQRVQDEKMEAARREEAKRAELVLQERLRIERLEVMVASETVVHQNYRWVASVPFGVGQFQNGDDVLGTLFLGTEVLALGAAVFSVSNELGIHSQANGGQEVRDAASYNEPLSQLRTAGVLSTAAFVFLAAVGVLEAHINFVPERAAGTRARPLPPEVRRKTPGLTVSPTLESTGRDLGLGLSGRF